MLDCPDAKELSTFYAKLLGKPVTYEGEGVAMIGEDGAQLVMFQQIQTGSRVQSWLSWRVTLRDRVPPPYQWRRR